MVDLSDPDFEPSDEDLQGLSKRAFSDVPAKNAKMLEEIRQRILQLSANAAKAAEAIKP
jgi:hypothetical protein